jgi:hypothetical protein
VIPLEQFRGRGLRGSKGCSAKALTSFRIDAVSRNCVGIQCFRGASKCERASRSRPAREIEVERLPRVLLFCSGGPSRSLMGEGFLRSASAERIICASAAQKRRRPCPSDTVPEALAASILIGSNIEALLSGNPERQRFQSLRPYLKSKGAGHSMGCEGNERDSTSSGNECWRMTEKLEPWSGEQKTIRGREARAGSQR